MGCCCCSSSKSNKETPAEFQQAQAQSKAIDGEMNQDRINDKQINKLLLFGAGESGKSTVFKQIITLYGRGFTEPEREVYAPIIYNNIIISIKTLCRYSQKYGPVSPDNQQALEAIDELKGSEQRLDSDICELILQLWADPGIQETYNQRSHFQLTDSTSYFMSKLREICVDGYIPTKQDVLRCRARTTGILEYDFEVDGSRFKLFDVGGQRNERKKWIHCFENVTAVLFIAAMSEYDQVLFEDEKTNRLFEALNLFTEICNSRWFTQTSMILFLNKRDLFADKISKVPLTSCFPSYTGKQNYAEASQYLKEVFESKNKIPDKVVYTHFCCATDSENVQHIFDAVKDTIIRMSLGQAGLLFTGGHKGADN